MDFRILLFLFEMRTKVSILSVDNEILKDLSRFWPQISNFELFQRKIRFLAAF